MGGGSWTSERFRDYSTSRSRGVDSTTGRVILSDDVTQNYTQRGLAKELNPFNVKRECRDSEEHPNTVPVILALDVTGSMGKAANEVAAELNNIMTELYEKVANVEFMIAAIGDFSYDDAPLQVSQFESDIRIAEQLDKVYFERGGGPNDWESYSAIWKFAAERTELDCWKRGKKGIIITMGDEILNPYIDNDKYEDAVKQSLMACGFDTKKIYEAVKDKYDLYHINVDHRSYKPSLSSWYKVLGKDHVFDCSVKEIAQIIPQIITAHESESFITGVDVAPKPDSIIEFTNEISW